MATIGVKIGIRDDKLCAVARLRARAVAVLLPGERLVPQRELEAVVGGLQARLLERLLQLRLLTLQQVQRVGAIGRHVRRHQSIAIDVKTHVDPAQLRRIKTDIELV